MDLIPSLEVFAFISYNFLLPVDFSSDASPGFVDLLSDLSGRLSLEGGMDDGAQAQRPTCALGQLVDGGWELGEGAPIVLAVTAG